MNMQFNFMTCFCPRQLKGIRALWSSRILDPAREWTTVLSAELLRVDDNKVTVVIGRHLNVTCRLLVGVSVSSSQALLRCTPDSPTAAPVTSGSLSHRRTTDEVSPENMAAVSNPGGVVKRRS